MPLLYLGIEEGVTKLVDYNQHCWRFIKAKQEHSQGQINERETIFIQNKATELYLGVNKDGDIILEARPSENSKWKIENLLV